MTRFRSVRRGVGRLLFVSVAAGAVLCAASSASAQVNFSEQGDAGDLPATAQAPGGSGVLDSISGALTDIADVDMFRVCLTAGGTFSATTAGTATTVGDSMLFLFDAAGLGVYANDDSAGSLQSTLPAGNPNTPTAAGVYYLAISSFLNPPRSDAGEIFTNFVFDPVNDLSVGLPGPPGGSSPVNGWDGGGGYDGTYSIVLTGAEPCGPAVATPATKNDCKRDRWRNLTDDEGRPFKNQGACIKFVNHL